MQEKLKTEKYVMWAIGLVILLGIGTGSWMLWDRFSGNADMREVDTPELRQAAEFFAKRTDVAGCESESIRRYLGCSDTLLSKTPKNPLDAHERLRITFRACSNETKLFHKYCVESARPSGELCRQPKPRHEAVCGSYKIRSDEVCREIVETSDASCR